MGKWWVFFAVILLLVSFAMAISITTGAVDNSTGLQNQAGATTGANKATVSTAIEARKGNLTSAQIKKVTQSANRIVTNVKAWETCPFGCTCTGSTVKCQMASGRIMTVYAGESGNAIVQVRGENMTTKVMLYNSEGKLYAVFKNNETKEIKAFPEQVRERIRERLQRQLENENITLDENSGTYQYRAEKRMRLFLVFPVRVAVTAEVNPETGEIIKLKAGKWWGFLAKDDSQVIVGASCGTVTPGQNDGCCQTKGFDFWNAETQQCEFSQ